MEDDLNWATMDIETRRKAILFWHEAGCTQSQMAEAWSTNRRNISAFAARHNLPNVGRGARLQNTNAQIDGLGRTTIKRKTRNILLAAGRDLFICERCKTPSTVELPRHHKDRNRSNNDPSNLEVLCNFCHAQEHLPERGRSEKGTFE